MAVDKSKKDKRIVVKAAPSLSRPSHPKKEAKEEVTAPSPQPTLPPSQPIARTQNVKKRKEEHVESALNFLITPMSFIIPLIWIALFSYLNFASFSSNPDTNNIIKMDLSGAFLTIIFVQIALFMFAVGLRCVSYFKIRGSKFLVVISFTVLFCVFLLTPMPLILILVLVRELSIIIYVAYFLIVILASLSVFIVTFRKTSKA